MGIEHKLQLAALAVTLAAAPGHVLAAGVDLCLGRVTDRDLRAVPQMAKPAYLTTYSDPAFGTPVTRISNAPAGGVIKTMYNTVQAWNIDESKLILYQTGGDMVAGHYLYDGQTYAPIRALNITPSDIEEVFWDPKSADHFFYIQRYPVTDEFYDTLVRYNVNTDEKEIVIDLGAVCGHPERAGGSASTGGDVQAIQGDQLGVRCNNNSFNGNSTDTTFIVNVRTGEMSNTITIDPAQPFSGNPFGYAANISISATASNQRGLLQGTVVDTNMNLVRNLDISYNTRRDDNGVSRSIPKSEHSSNGQLPNGHDALFSAIYDPAANGCNGDANRGVGSLVSYDLETGACNVILGSSTGWGYPLSGVHPSALATGAPGWVATSAIGYGRFDYFTNSNPAPLTFSEILLTYADADNPKTCRLAHTRTHAKSAVNVAGYRYGYFGEPHPVISPSGTRILFSSDWYDSGSVDTYVVDLRDGNPEPETPAPEPETPAPEPETPAPEPETPAPEPETPDNPPISSGVTLTPSQTTYRAGDRVIINFTGAGGAGNDAVTIAPVGSSDRVLRMWIYTNGSQRISESGPASGSLRFYSKYIGIGEFEARYFPEAGPVPTERVRFFITE